MPDYYKDIATWQQYEEVGERCERAVKQADRETERGCRSALDVSWSRATA